MPLSGLAFLWLPVPDGSEGLLLVFMGEGGVTRLNVGVSLLRLSGDAAGESGLPAGVNDFRLALRVSIFFPGGDASCVS